jgi:hypothetical protein
MSYRAWIAVVVSATLLASSGESPLFAQSASVRPSNEARVLANVDRSAGALFTSADTNRNGQLSKTELSKADPRVQSMASKLASNLNPAFLPAPDDPPNLAGVDGVDKLRFQAYFRSIIRQRALDAMEQQRQQQQLLLAQQEALLQRDAQARAAAAAMWNAQAAAARRDHARDRDRQRERDRRERDRDRDRERRNSRRQNQTSGGGGGVVTTTTTRAQTGVPRGTNPFPVVPR